MSASGQFSFAGIEDNYFAGVFLPRNKPSVEVTTFSDNVPDAEGKTSRASARRWAATASTSLRCFVGPKDTDLLRKVDPKLEQLIDWGWFGSSPSRCSWC